MSEESQQRQRSLVKRTDIEQKLNGAQKESKSTLQYREGNNNRKRYTGQKSSFETLAYPTEFIPLIIGAR